jgi:hypothetical protein
MLFMITDKTLCIVVSSNAEETKDKYCKNKQFQQNLSRAIFDQSTECREFEGNADTVQVCGRFVCCLYPVIPFNAVHCKLRQYKGL